jgi:hypothetical protein
MAMATAKGGFTGLSEQQKETVGGLVRNLMGAGGTLLVAGIALAVVHVLAGGVDETLTGLGSLLGMLIPWVESLAAVAVGAVALLAAGVARFVADTPFDEAQRPAFGSRGSLLGLLASATVALGGLEVLTGILGLFTVGAAALLPLVAGAITAFIGLVLIAAAADVGYIASTRGYEEAHTTNAISAFQTFFRALGLLTALVALVAFIRCWLYFRG